MRYLHWLAAASLMLPAAQLGADQPVTSPSVPPPGPVQARLWLEAMFQAPLLELGPGIPRSEAARMYIAVQREQKLGSGVGWYDPSRSRFDWSRLAARF